MSGRRRSIRITPAQCSVASAIPSAPLAASSVRSPAARSTSRASFAFCSLSSTIRTSGSRSLPSWPWPRRHVVSWSHADPARPRRGPLPRSRGDPAGCSRRSPTSRSARRAATSTSLLEAVDAENGRTSSSPTSACRRAASTKGSRPPLRLRETNPEVGVVVLSQYAKPSYALALLEGGSARPRVPPEGTREGSRATRRRDPRRRRGRLGDRSEGRRGARGGEGPRRGVAAQPADAARARRAARDGRGKEQRGDRRERSS